MSELDEINWQAYIRFYPDLKKAGITTEQAKEHWVKYGQYENRVLFTKEALGYLKKPRVSDKYKSIFIHIPKCAGTSVDYIIFGQFHELFDDKNSLWVQHATAAQVRDYFSSKDDWRDYFKFAFVRNPYDRIVSSYNWLCDEQKILKNKETFNCFIFRQGVFKELLDENEKNNIENRYHQITSAESNLYENGKLLVDFVGKYENLNNDWKFVCDRLNIKTDLPHEKKSSDKKEYFNKDTKEEVYRRYKKDFEIFGYDK